MYNLRENVMVSFMQMSKQVRIPVSISGVARRCTGMPRRGPSAGLQGVPGTPLPLALLELPLIAIRGVVARVLLGWPTSLPVGRVGRRWTGPVLVVRGGSRAAALPF